MHGTDLPRTLRVSPNIETRLGGKVPNLLILHYTGMDDANKACDWLCNPASKVSCHYLIDESGAIIQMVSEELRAWHAGVSHWQGETDINSVSIGIEIQNPGHSGGYPAFPQGQIKAVLNLCRDIVARHGIQPRRILAHSDVAPSRKVDPGEKFPWAELHGCGVGHWVAPLPLVGAVGLSVGDEGENVRALQAMLQRYGYEIRTAGTFDRQTELVVTAFQRHFRQQRVDGIADASTISTLERLIEA